MATSPKNEWRETTLDQEIEILSGGTPKTTVDEYWNGDVPWLSVADFNDEDRWVSDAQKSISRSGVENSATTILDKGDLIISARGTVGALAQVSRPMAFNQSCYGIRAKETTTNDFLYYLIKSKLPSIKRNVHGAVFDTITRDTFRQIEVVMPSLDEQRSIAGMLSSLDEKIELLSQQNETLEQIAQTLFQEEFVKKQKGTAGVLGDVLDVKGGSTPSTSNSEFWDGDIPWTTPKDLSNHRGVFLFDTQSKITTRGLEQISSGLLPKGTLLLSSRAPIGYLAIAAVPLAINQGYIAINSRGEWSNYFTFLWLKANMRLVEASANGSTFMEINKKSFREIECLLPDASAVRSFTEVVSPLFDKIFVNSKQIGSLSRVRDTLLPLLMSGKVGVE